MTARGPRFAAGYQFPRTDAAALKREPAIAREQHVGPHAATVELVPLTGGREIRWDLCAQWTEQREVAGQLGPTSCAWSFLLGGGAEDARAAFAELVDGFRDGVFPAWLP